MLRIHVGTYEKDRGRGLVPLDISDDGAIMRGEPFADAANASFGVRAGDLVYVVDERDEGAINVLRDQDGSWQRVARVASEGAAPCHVTLDRHGKRLAVANYASGSVALFALDAHGLPIGAPTLFQGKGSGPVAQRQEGPHAHCVRFSHGGEALYWVDLGSDRIHCLKLGPLPSGSAVFLEDIVAWRAPPGSGPRHLVFHPSKPLAFVLSELASTLTVLHARGGALLPHQSTSTLPAGFKGENLGGHLEIAAAGTRVYVSNRGHDSLAVFALDPSPGGGGQVELIQHIPSGGAHPRHFVLREDVGLVAVAHEKDGRVALFEIAADGTLAPKGEGATIPGACFLLD